ncbi:putative F-box and FNIP repeat-containing protein [Megavirus courdo11]|uniref:Putative F-box and FNIP repeat-containing protein n=1 Tax=Megavirus courdo11 TaxID=1128140 RepID=K7YFP9_9VIRU|nr:putative F-box and FNIP repeat-containing protein [Megavirus courdo11]
MSITDVLNIDTIMCILDYLKDRDKLSFMKTCKEYYYLRDCVNYTDLYEYDIIEKLPFTNKFKRLVYRGEIPNKNISTSKFVKKYFAENLDNPIPNDITHLTFGYQFNQNVKNCIPNSVTHLTFGIYFNQDIKDCIPNSVTHLTFGLCFNQDIKNCIPNSVTHIHFGHKFNQNIKDCIPNSVIYLEFGTDFNQNIKDCIPNSVIYLEFGTDLIKI